MEMKQSQAFAAFRTSLITDKNHAILNELVPVFNSQCEDIRRKAEKDFETYKNQALVDNRKKSAIYDLIMYRKQIIDGVQHDLRDKINERLAKDEATLREEEIDDNGKIKHITTAIFPDGSFARVPASLWIDYSVFDRV